MGRSGGSGRKGSVEGVEGYWRAMGGREREERVGEGASEEKERGGRRVERGWGGEEREERRGEGGGERRGGGRGEGESREGSKPALAGNSIQFYSCNLV